MMMKSYTATSALRFWTLVVLVTWMCATNVRELLTKGSSSHANVVQQLLGIQDEPQQEPELSSLEHIPTTGTAAAAEALNGSSSGQCPRQCQRLFLVDGIQPGTSNPAWQACRCDELYCEESSRSISGEASDGAGIGCQWSLLAIDMLMDSLELDQACSPEAIKEFLPDPFWERYRLASYFFGNYIKYPNPGVNISLPYDERWRQFRLTEYNQSLFYEYHQETLKQRHTVNRGDWDVLLNVVQRRLTQSNSTDNRSTMQEEQTPMLPEPNTLVIHLRIGDVLDVVPESVRDILHEPQYFLRLHNDTRKCCLQPWEGPHNPQLQEPTNQYAKPLSHFAKILQNIHSSSKPPYSSIVLMGSAHKGQIPGGDDDDNDEMEATKSCQYTKTVQAFLQRSTKSYNTKVSLRLGQAPDDDVIFASQADGYIPAGGSFTRVIEGLHNATKYGEAWLAKQRRNKKGRRKRQQTRRQQEKGRHRDDGEQ